MEKFFNIAGPCVAAQHYMLPAIERLPEVPSLVRKGLYFVIHAPRQSGKTTALKQLVRDINGSGERVAMYCSLETLQNVTDVTAAMHSVETLVAKAMKLSPPLAARADETLAFAGSDPVVRDPTSGLMALLTKIAADCGKPLVVFFDEADCLCYDPLIAFLRQLRNGYVNREDAPFPASLALVGLRKLLTCDVQTGLSGRKLIRLLDRSFWGHCCEIPSYGAFAAEAA